MTTPKSYKALSSIRYGFFLSLFFCDSKTYSETCPRSPHGGESRASQPRTLEGIQSKGAGTGGMRPAISASAWRRWQGHSVSLSPGGRGWCLSTSASLQTRRARGRGRGEEPAPGRAGAEISGTAPPKTGRGTLPAPPVKWKRARSLSLPIVGGCCMAAFWKGGGAECTGRDALMKAEFWRGSGCVDRLRLLHLAGLLCVVLLDDWQGVGLCVEHPVLEGQVVIIGEQEVQVSAGKGGRNG